MSPLRNRVRDQPVQPDRRQQQREPRQHREQRGHVALALRVPPGSSSIVRKRAIGSRGSTAATADLHLRAVIAEDGPAVRITHFGENHVCTIPGIHR